VAFRFFAHDKVELICKRTFSSVVWTFPYLDLAIKPGGAVMVLAIIESPHAIHVEGLKSVII